MAYPGIRTTERSVLIEDTQLGGYAMTYPNIARQRWEVWKVTPYYEREYRAREIKVCGVMTFDYPSTYPSRSIYIEVMYCRAITEYEITQEVPIPPDIYTAYLMGRSRTVARWRRTALRQASEFIGREISRLEWEVYEAIEDAIAEFFNPALLDYSEKIGTWVTTDPYILTERWYGEYCHGRGSCNDIEAVVTL